MKEMRTIRREKAQKKYRKKQSSKGLVRYEIQIPEEIKTKFEQMVSSVADEYEAPWDERQRKAAARAEVFAKAVHGTLHEFNALKSQIKTLQDEIKALAPKFFSEIQTTAPLPSAIRSLPDDPNHLKMLLAKLFSEGQQAKRQAVEYKRRADQYEELYTVSSDYVDELQRQLKK